MCQDFQILLLWLECTSNRIGHYIIVVKTYIKHTRKSFTKAPIQVPVRKKKHKQETKTTSEKSEEVAKLNERAKKFLAHHRINRQPQNF